jgi:hypothetical protein
LMHAAERDLLTELVWPRKAQGDGVSRPVDMFKLDNTPYRWVHPDDEG